MNSFVELLEELGHGQLPEAEFVAICHQRRGERFSSTVAHVTDAPSVVASLPTDADVWFSINSVTGPARTNAGRGTAADTTRLLTLPADLDVKPGGMPSMEAAHRVVEELASLLNCQPIAVTMSGHGLQPLWSLDDGAISSSEDRSRMRALVRRWGRLVARVAEMNGGAVDSIFDLSRVLRVPGTTNHKAEPVDVVTTLTGGRPLTIEELEERLDEYAVPKLSGDDDDFGGPQVTAPAEWSFGEQTWPYVRVMVGRWREDTPKARHLWLTAQFVRIIAAWRLARITEDDARTAREALLRRFRELLQSSGNQREVDPGEVSSAWVWALAKVCAMSEERAAEEIGGLDAKPPRAPEKSAPVTSKPEPVAKAPEARGVVAVDPGAFFGKEGPLVADIGRAVMEIGPMRWGRDESWWTYADGVWSPAERVIVNRCTALLGNRYRRAIAGNTEDVVRARVERLDCAPVKDYLNFTNGMLDWRTGTLHEHAESYGSTVQFPLAWEPMSACPNFDRFLDSILSPDYVRLAWQMIGYLMYSGNPLQVAFLFHGSGRNGKGTLMRVVEGLLGTHNVSSQSLDSLNTNRFSAINLFGKIANLAGDIDATYQESTASFKKLTGEDTYNAERKYGDQFQFTNWAVPVFSANKIPGSSDTSHGYLRRWVVLMFERTFDHPIQGLSDRLLAELPGIAARAAREIAPLIDAGEFTITGDALLGKERFAESIDQVRQWVSEATENVEGNAIPLPDAFSAYRQWTHNTGVGMLKQKEFVERLEAIGYRCVKRGGYRMVVGLRVTMGPQRLEALRMEADGINTDDAQFRDVVNGFAD